MYHRWYRAKIISVAADDKVDVFFLDYGDAEYVSSADILPIPLVLRRMPFQAIECCCLDIESVGSEWSETICDEFMDLFYNKTFHAQVTQLTDVVLLSMVLRQVLPYSLPSIRPGADPGVQAVSPQVSFQVTFFTFCQACVFTL